MCILHFAGGCVPSCGRSRSYTLTVWNQFLDGVPFRCESFFRVRLASLMDPCLVGSDTVVIWSSESLFNPASLSLSTASRHEVVSAYSNLLTRIDRGQFISTAMYTPFPRLPVIYTVLSYFIVGLYTSRRRVSTILR